MTERRAASGLSNGFGDGLTLTGSVKFDVNDRDAIKEYVKTHGGVIVATLDRGSKRERFGKYCTMNDTDGDDFDHDVTVIGWDDNFPKEYFIEQPKENGAWIAYNSNLGSTDLYYISYESLIVDVFSHSVSDEYSGVLFYDWGSGDDRYIKTGDSTTAANVFREGGRLAAVGTYNNFDSQDIIIEIYDADFGELLYSQAATLDYNGY